MKSLFTRIFLSFWLAMGLILVGSVGVTATFILKRSAEIQSLVPSELAAAAEARFVAGGKRELREWVEEVRSKHPGLDIVVVDAFGKAVTKRKAPDFVQRRINRMQHEGLLNGPSRLGGPNGGDPLRSTPQITAANGAVYTMFFSQVPDWSPAVLGTPAIQVMLLLLAMVVSGSICWYLARSVTRPVERLQVSARALAGGDLDARVGDEFAARKDELAVLAHDFDQMADRLRSLIDSKEVLMRDVSHELRTPLARLRLALGLARREGADLEREHDRIEREAERLDELIGEILRLASLNSSQQQLHRENFDYANLVADVAEDARLEARAQNKQVSFNYDGELRIDADQELLRSAIENVVRNAVRFTATNTAVEISVTTHQRMAVLTVRDHGPGVPEAELVRLFEPFYRVTQQARERDTGGYGLGLAITARVIGVHHGKVDASNAADGGLVVTLSVPLSSASITV
ncbi:MAG: ATP-binding protein [Steroidobacteraceae bacterium]